MKVDIVCNFCQTLSMSVGCALIYQRATKRRKKYKCVSKKVKYYGTFFVKMVYLYENIIV